MLFRCAYFCFGEDVPMCIRLCQRWCPDAMVVSGNKSKLLNQRWCPLCILWPEEGVLMYILLCSDGLHFLPPEMVFRCAFCCSNMMSRWVLSWPKRWCPDVHLFGTKTVSQCKVYCAMEWCSDVRSFVSKMMSQCSYVCA